MMVLLALELSFDSTRVRCQELVVMHTKFSMLGNFLVHAWGWCGGLNKYLFILVHSGPSHF